MLVIVLLILFVSLWLGQRSSEEGFWGWNSWSWGSWWTPQQQNMNRYVSSAWYPISSGTTRNMSYDLRGDPYIPYRSVGPWGSRSHAFPWNQSTIAPIRNRSMEIGGLGYY